MYLLLACPMCDAQALLAMVAAAVTVLIVGRLCGKMAARPRAAATPRRRDRD